MILLLINSDSRPVQLQVYEEEASEQDTDTLPVIPEDASQASKASCSTGFSPKTHVMACQLLFVLGLEIGQPQLQTLPETDSRKANLSDDQRSDSITAVSKGRLLKLISHNDHTCMTAL